MNSRKVPGVPPRPIFAIVVALRHLLVRLWRRLAPAQVVMFESMFQGLQTVHIARAACQLGLPEHLVDGPRSVEDLALASGTKPELLVRFLRTLAKLMNERCKLGEASQLRRPHALEEITS